MKIFNDVDFIKKILDQQIANWHLYDSSENLSLEIPEDRFINQLIKILRSNYNLWHLEDVARDPFADDSVIADIKRKIDRENQIRNDQIEQMDMLIKNFIEEKNIIPKTKRFNSETPGSIIDRITILSLKIYHMHEQTLRKDADKSHIESCKKKLEILKIQRDDLLKALKELIYDILNGEKTHKVYFQFKMYNDPSLNPAIYKKAKGSKIENFDN